MPSCVESCIVGLFEFGGNSKKLAPPLSSVMSAFKYMSFVM